MCNTFFRLWNTLGTHAKTFAERGSAHRTDHELLESDRSVRMRTAVDDVHHRHGQRLGIHTADVAVERQTEIVGGSAGYGQRNTQDGVGAQLRFGRRTVQRDHRLVDAHLIRYAHTDDRRSNDVIHVLHRLLDTFARITLLSPSRSSSASCSPVEAPLGTAARPNAPDTVFTSTSMVGLPLESRISLAWISTICIVVNF